MYRAILVKTMASGDIIVIDQPKSIESIFCSFGEPAPNTDRAIVSMEFREYIGKYGFVYELPNYINPSRVRYIPPAQIEWIDFYVGKEKPPYDNWMNI